MTNVLQRDRWDGHPVDLGTAWSLHKRDREACCALVSHQLGWELRLVVGELVRSQVCRSNDEILDTAEAWKRAMVGRGWQEV